MALDDRAEFAKRVFSDRIPPFLPPEVQEQLAVTFDAILSHEFDAMAESKQRADELVQFLMVEFNNKVSEKAMERGIHPFEFIQRLMVLDELDGEMPRITVMSLVDAAFVLGYRLELNFVPREEG